MAIVTLTSTESGANSLNDINANFLDLDTRKANLASPTFTGTPILPTGTTGVTQSASDNSTKLATTAYADTAVAAGGSSCKTAFPMSPMYNNSSGGAPGTAIALSSNTTMYVGQVVVPFAITANKISIYTGNTITTPGTVDITLYSEIGQTQIFAVTTASLSAATTVYTTALSAVLIPAGIYYIAINSNTTFNGDIYFYNITNSGAFALTSLQSGVTSEPVLQGTMTITASTPATTFNPVSGITAATNSTLAFRLDN